MPPTEPPRAARPKPRRPPPKPRPSAQNAQAYVSQGRAVEKTATRQRQAVRAQRQTQNAQPLSPRPQRPTPIAVPRPTVARPLQAAPPRVTRASRPVDTARQARGVAVAAYDQLSGQAKQAHARAAAKRVAAGKDTQTDRAILHAHTTRVAGKKKVVAATRAFDVIAGAPQQIEKLKQAAQNIEDSPFTAPSAGTSRFLPPGSTYGPPDKHGHRPILDRAGKQTGIAAKWVRPNVGSVADMPGVGAVIHALGPAASKGLKSGGVPKVIANIPKDAAELAITSPTAVVKSLSTAVAHPKQEAQALIKPYKTLASETAHGKTGFVTERPVTTALMLNPLARAPGRLTGKVLRTTGKQTLKRGTAVLPGSAMREEVIGSRAAGRRGVQSAKDKRAARRNVGEEPRVTARQVNQRVDEAFAAATRHGVRVRNAIGKKARVAAKDLPKDERKQYLEDMGKAASGVASRQTQTRFAREFGATAEHADGQIIENAGPHAQGHLHDTAADARAVAEHLNAQGHTIPKGHGKILTGDPLGRLYAKDRVPVNYVVRKVGDPKAPKHAVVPEQVANRLEHHQAVGSTQARGAKLLRLSRTLFTRSVLPYRPSWLSGQAVEGTVRAAIKNAGPTSYLRTKRFTAALERQQPGAGKEFLTRAQPAGLVGQHQLETPHRTFKGEFPESNVARALTDLGQTPGLKQVRELNRHVTDFVFNKLNAKALEGVPQTAMLGKVLKDSPLMERKLVGLSRKAMDEAAAGALKPETQVGLLRELQKSYGKYEGHSPHIRELISHWTPFLPWYLNTARFLLSTLPKDHPTATALIADMDAATEDWRKQQGLSFRHKENQVPGFMLGGYPVKGDSTVGKVLGLKKDQTHILRIGHYTPAGIGSDVLGAASGLPLPQFSGFYNALHGVDWKDQPLKHTDGRPFSESEKFVYGLTQLAEAFIPLSSQVTSVTGVPGGIQEPAPDKGEAVKKLARPISAVPRRKTQSGGVQIAPVKIKPVKIKPVKIKPISAG